MIEKRWDVVDGLNIHLRAHDDQCVEIAATGSEIEYPSSATMQRRGSISWARVERGACLYMPCYFLTLPGDEASGVLGALRDAIDKHLGAGDAARLAEIARLKDETAWLRARLAEALKR